MAEGGTWARLHVCGSGEAIGASLLFRCQQLPVKATGRVLAGTEDKQLLPSLTLPVQRLKSASQLSRT